MSDHWMREAACRDCPPNLFFPERGESTEPALAVCAACPVIQECYDYCSSMSPMPDGIWGGTTAAGRNGSRRRQRARRLRLVESA